MSQKQATAHNSHSYMHKREYDSKATSPEAELINTRRHIRRKQKTCGHRHSLEIPTILKIHRENYQAKGELSSCETEYSTIVNH